jgi:RNA polymerase sigma-70 factor (ECF subfamily)
MMRTDDTIVESPRAPGAWLTYGYGAVPTMESSRHPALAPTMDSPGSPPGPTPGSAPGSAPGLSAEASARFRGLVDNEFALVWRFLRGLGVAASGVDDAAQQVFWIAAQRLSDIAFGSERSFLLSTARGVASNARRAQARTREVPGDEILAERSDERANPEQAAATTQARRLLEGFLEELPEDARTVFVLFELEGLTMAAIAEALELAPGTVASRLRRGREAFQAATKRFQAQRMGRRP